MCLWVVGRQANSLYHPDVLYRMQCMPMILETRQEGSLLSLCICNLPAVDAHDELSLACTWLGWGDWTTGNGSGS